MHKKNKERVSITDLGQMYFPRLPNTRIEGEIIASILGADPLFEDQVLESTIKSRVSPYILHIATHGFLIPQQQFSAHMKLDDFVEGWWMTPLHISKQVNPLLFSGLALAGANNWTVPQLLPNEAEDGLLTAEDIREMDLTGTELVVLSACGSGLGYVMNGEGLFGLRRSFVLAGSQTLIMSLWKVPDHLTKKLMIEFYVNLSKSSDTSRSGALRNAQLRIKEENPDPVCWGAFICQGNPKPMSL